jgi:hypothetical protein
MMGVDRSSELRTQALPTPIGKHYRVSISANHSVIPGEEDTGRFCATPLGDDIRGNREPRGSRRFDAAWKG